MVQQTLARLEQDPEWRRTVTCRRDLPARPPRFAPFPPGLNPRLRDALARRGIEQLYTHQARAVELVLQGQHVVLVTPTASGKTLAYNLPVLHTLLEDPSARALYLFPTKALAQDQLHALQALIEELGIPVQAAVYDGDTPAAARRAIRASANVVLTNPDMLHTGILPHHTKWLSLWTNLRYIVLDEVHQYRGVFGSHLANVLRRIRRIARFYGCEPRFIACSATIANPREFVERLIDAPVAVVDENGAPQGPKHFFIVHPPLVDAALHLRRSSLLEARRVAGVFLADNVPTIVFTRSRLATEVLLRYLRHDAPNLGLEPEAVRGYRGGYLPRERRAIERGLRAGTVRGVVSTNALELGVDIGDLEACVMVGYPGTVASTWQQAGRGGRRGRPSAVVLVAGPSPLDQFLATHPEWLFDRSPEHARVHPDNVHILVDHIRCAAFELPFRADEGFGRLPPEVVREILEFLVEEGALHRAGDTYYWMAPNYPAERVSLRTVSRHTVTILEQPGGTPVGEVDRHAVHQMCFPGAIYLHEGRQYLIESVDWDQGQALARPVEVEYFTTPVTRTTVEPVRTLAEAPGRALGDVAITAQVVGFKKVRFFTHEVIGREALDLPPWRFEAPACWFTLPVEVGPPPRHDYGPNWTEQRARARARDGYRCQRCGISEAELGRELDVHHLIPFREFKYDPHDPARANRYLEANRLENLITLCPACHRQAEPWHRGEVAVGLHGAARAIGHVAPLFLMCDPHDIGVTSDLRAPTGQPTIYLYEWAPGGVGLADQAFELYPLILKAAADLVADCPCDHGCPACVGPEAPPEAAPKQRALDVLTLLRGEKR